uniref:Uncharacterized protein n=1 Tax=Ditylenchus dipsaci TaxID=166011 RepID=A0A915CYQ0_9BILA
MELFAAKLFIDQLYGKLNPGDHTVDKAVPTYRPLIEYSQPEDVNDQEAQTHRKRFSSIPFRPSPSFFNSNNINRLVGIADDNSGEVSERSLKPVENGGRTHLPPSFRFSPDNSLWRKYDTLSLF